MEQFSILQGVFGVVDQLLAPFVIRFFFVFSIVAFAVGVGLIVDHVRMQQLFGVMNRWVSTRHGTKWLAVPRDIGPAVQQFRRPIGAVFVLIAAYSTFILLTQVNIDRFVAALGVAAPHAFVAWLVGCVHWFLLLGGLVAIAVGFMLMFSPQALRAIETRVNHWYSLRRVSQSFDAMHWGLDRWVAGYPGAAGWLIAVPALFLIGDYGLMLFSQR